jgi:hypothetical protein
LKEWCYLWERIPSDPDLRIIEEIVAFATMWMKTTEENAPA